MSSNERRRPTGRRRLSTLLLAGLAFAACGPVPTPSPSGVAASASPETSPSPSSAPSTLAAPPDDRLVVLLVQSPAPTIVTWHGGSVVDLPPPRPGTSALAIGPDGRAAILANDGVFVADGLAADARWSAVPELRPPADAIVTGLTWSPDGKLAWAADREAAVPPFTIVAGSPGQTPTRIEVDASLDGRPAWLDGDRIAVPVVREPSGGLAIVSLAGNTIPFEPIPAGVLAVAPSKGILALGDRYRPRIEIRRIEDLTAAGGQPLAVFEEPGGEDIADLAFSADGRWLAVAWMTWAGDWVPLAVALYEDAGGWVERGRLDLAPIGARPDAAVSLAWRP